MKYIVTMMIEVDEDATFMSSDRNENVEALTDLISDAIYEIDDTKILTLEVEEE